MRLTGVGVLRLAPYEDKMHSTVGVRYRSVHVAMSAQVVHLPRVEHRRCTVPDPNSGASAGRWVDHRLAATTIAPHNWGFGLLAAQKVLATPDFVDIGGGNARIDLWAPSARKALLGGVASVCNTAFAQLRLGQAIALAVRVDPPRQTSPPHPHLAIGT